MNNDLISKLSNLKLEENNIRRNIDKFYLDNKMRTRLFKRLKENSKEQEMIKFKMRLEKKIKNEKLRENIWTKF